MKTDRRELCVSLAAVILLLVILGATWTDEKEADKVRAELKECHEEVAVLTMQKDYWRAR